MVNSKREDLIDEDKIEESYITDNVSEESVVGVSSMEIESSCVVDSTGPSTTSRESSRSSGNERELTEMLRGIFREEGDEDLLLRRTDRENGIVQWLQALDVQVMGGCRADERLKPLMKLNVSSVVTDDSLLAHISQYFEASEVGMLARCLCIPLVTIRVGKVVKQGTLLCPTTIRGSLYLTLLPTSDLRISFAGDDGFTQEVATLNNNSESSVAIEEIPADNSGRSFLIKLPDGEVSYFWCSEKSKLLGMELLRKMKDIVRRKPSLSQLTGISESRLDCFATHLHTYLIGSTVSNTKADTNDSSSSVVTVSNPPELDQSIQLLPASTMPCCARFNSSQAEKAHALYQSSLGPRSNSFKDGLPRNLPLSKSISGESIVRLGEGHLSVENLPVASTFAAQACTMIRAERDDILEVSRSEPLLPLGFLRSLDSLPSVGPFSSQIPPIGGPKYSPCYCWCPPSSSTLQCSATSSQLPIPSSNSLSLPTLSFLSSDTSSPIPLFPPESSIDITDVKSLDFPALLPDPMFQFPLPVSSIISAVSSQAFLPDPMFQFPLPVSSIISAVSSQQIPTFTPLMCDPIVHIPVIDVCSLGQGYLVSAGPAISTTIPSLPPNFMSPLIPETESVVEKGARETLRLLISSSQTNSQIMGMLPVVMSSTDEKHGNLGAGSRGLYSGMRDVGVIESSAGAMGLLSQQKIQFRDDDWGNISQGAGGPDKSCCSDTGGARDSLDS